MKAEWLCKLGGQPCGPFSVDQLRQLAVAGTIDATTEVRREKDPRWFPAGKVPGLITPAAAPAMGAATSATPAARVDAAAPAKPRPRLAATPATVATASVHTPPAGAPVGRPVAPVVARPAPPTGPNDGALNLVFNTDSPSSSGPMRKVDPAHGAKPRKSSNSLILVASLGGLCLLIAIVGGVLLVINARGSGEHVAEAAEDGASADELSEIEGSAPLSPEAEANPAALHRNTPEGDADSASGVVKTKAAISNRAGDPAKQALAEIKSWNSLANRVQLGLKGIARFEVTSVWLAADAAGKRIPMKPAAPAQPAEGTASTTSSGVANLEPAQTPLFVFAEVTITNTGDAPVKYQGWNGLAGTTALLVDETGSPLELVPSAETPKITRLASTFIPPGGSVNDTIVFRAPAAAVQKFRLALPKPALSSLAKGFFAIEVPPETLFRQPAATQFANRNLTGPRDKAALNEFAELQRQLMADDAPAADIQPATAAAPAADVKAEGEMAAGKPPESKLRSAEDFDKFLRDRDQDGDAETDGAKMPTDKAGEKAT